MAMQDGSAAVARDMAPPFPVPVAFPDVDARVLAEEVAGERWDQLPQWLRRGWAGGRARPVLLAVC
ncbi:conserved protein of unknown function [Rhodovastum atsumiense]|uniref:Uncharacterized protein n=1 Tax=Rhodovastum atsumiense TaxID=504468 RepID=A0A5M6IZB2_9PROT|nr:hypothetical protein [Rhodovastum atsumiense]KAA5613690.1 hypothetical protein F1189_04580 [Rhodovastum atsumiense]CAH2599608.1 conserved protein of unknown function [Rhodovastum atsumiense]